MPFRIASPPSRFATYCPADGLIQCDMLSENDFIVDWGAVALDDSLEFITVEPNPTGLVSSIDIRPSGSIAPVGGGGATTMNWDGGAGRWEPASELILDDLTFYLFEVTLTITLKAGGSCSYDVAYPLQYIDLGNVPTANPTISGVRQVGQTLTGSDGYFHPDGIAQDVANTVRQWYSYTNSAGTTGETLIGTGATYVLTSAEAEKYIRYRVTPAAVSGPSPGATVSSPVTGIIAPNTVIYTLTNSRTGIFTLTNTMNSAGALAIDWGDGSALEIFAVTSTAAQNYTKTYTAGTRTIRVFAINTRIAGLSAASMSVTACDISAATNLASLVLNFNAGLTAITMPSSNTATWTSFAVINCGLTGTLNLSTLGSMPTIVNFNGNAGLTGFVGRAGAGKCTQLQGFGCNLTGTLNLTGVDVGGNIQLNTNPNLTGLTIDTSTTSMTVLMLNNCNFSSLDLSALALGGNISIAANTSLSSLTYTATANKINYLYANNTAFTTLDVSGLTGLVQLWAFSCASLTDVVMPAAGAFAMTQLYIYSSALNYSDFSAVNFATSVIIRLEGNGMTAAEVNCILEDLASALPVSGTGSVRIDGSNAAPNSTSGGCDGLAAVTAINSKGYTITTS